MSGQEKRYNAICTVRDEKGLASVLVRDAKRKPLHFATDSLDAIYAPRGLVETALCAKFTSSFNNVGLSDNGVKACQPTRHHQASPSQTHFFPQEHR